MVTSNGTPPSPTPNGHAHGPAFDPLKLPEGMDQGQVNRVLGLIENATSSRQDFFRKFFDPRRNINQECGYPTAPPGAEWYHDLADDGYGIADRVNKVYSRESWQVQPTVYESKDTEDVTEFERAWDALGKTLRGVEGGLEASWYADEKGSPVWEYLQRADEQAGKGRYGIILLGFDDVETEDGLRYPVAEADYKPLDEKDVPGGLPDAKPGTRAGKPAAILNEDHPLHDDQVGYYEELYRYRDGVYTNAEQTEFARRGGTQDVPSMTGTSGKPKRRRGKGRRLLYLRVFPETLCPVARFDNNPSSPRYQKPEAYNVTFFDSRNGPITGTGLNINQREVHWSRVIHVSDNLESNEVYGTERCRPVRNQLLGLQKIYGGSPEMYWRGALPGVSISTHPQLGGEPTVNMTATRDAMENYMNGLQRYLLLMGMSATTLAPTVVDPTPQKDILIEAVCINIGMPIRVFKGSERGELASSQDDQAWNDRLRYRQNTHLTPRVVIPFVNRLIAAGVLPEPEQGFHVEWPDLTSQSQAEKADVAVKKTQALAAYTGPGAAGTLIAPQDYLTRVLGMDEADAETVIENADKHAEEKQKKDMEQKQKMIDEGLAPPTPGTPAAIEAGAKQAKALGAAQGEAKLAATGKPPAAPAFPPVKNNEVHVMDGTTSDRFATNAKDRFKEVGDWLADNGLMPGYGQIFVNDENDNVLDEVWYVGGDGDERGFDKLVERKLKALGAKSVRYEAEYFPPRDQSWVQVYPKRRAWVTTVDNYDPHQRRAMKGTQFGGRWVKATGGGALAGPRIPTAKELLTRPLRGATVQAYQAEPKTAPPPGAYYKPNVHRDHDGDGVTDQARVGVPAHHVPPPPPIKPLPNLTPHERAVEQKFINAYERDPDGMAEAFRDLSRMTTKKGDPITFGTDDAKHLVEEWAHPSLTTEQRATNRATLNLALHQTANAIAKRAFLRELDTLRPGQEVLVTVGGCGAGKGYALKNVPQALEMKKRASVVWDSAGDQNATENPWIQAEAEKRGLKVNYVYVHADPYQSWAHPERGVVKRAGDPNDGRMVDAHVFADSYALGAKNHARFHDANRHNPSASFVFLSNFGKPALIPGIPPEALRLSSKKLTRFALRSVQESNAPARVKRGATMGVRVWGTH